jgi:hypothetical protein
VNPNVQWERGLILHHLKANLDNFEDAAFRLFVEVRQRLHDSGLADRFYRRRSVSRIIELKNSPYFAKLLKARNINTHPISVDVNEISGRMDYLNNC